LPIIVAGLVYSSNPTYLEPLWTEQMGQIMLAGAAFWMMCGILIMKKMINFKY
jgi:tight adherence protein B